MIELPESITLSQQIDNELKGKKVSEVWPATNPSKFAFFNDDHAKYAEQLIGKKIISSKGYGIYVDIFFEDNLTLSLNDGITMVYGDKSVKVPEKYQLLICFDDETFLALSVAMYAGIYLSKEGLDNKYYNASKESISPLSDQFDKAFFDGLLAKEKKDLSMKALLATEQRIPGVGNGVVQDILFNARLHPKRKMSTLTENDKLNLFNSLKQTLQQMTDLGGRDTETNLFGNKGGYKTLLSKNTYNRPCPSSGHFINKDAYLGGSIYYCPICQPLPATKKQKD